MKDHDSSRRKFTKKLVYIAPAILTLKAQPSFAASGSGGGGTGGYQYPRHRHRRHHKKFFF